jgi:S1-C subfamily serine protease
MSGRAKSSRAGRGVEFARAIGAGAWLHLLVVATIVAAGEPPSAREEPHGGPAEVRRAQRPAALSTQRRAPVPWDDRTYRATVLVRRGTSQGSGTIIASVDGATLVLTAAHVVKAEGPVLIELHRYNLGMERQPATSGAWPRVLKASVAAVDTAADLSVVRIGKAAALPYVARFTRDQDEPPPDTTVTSIGIDLGRKLTHWDSRLVEIVKFELNDSRTARPFLITEKIPQHGRSGGGLFLTSGDLVGVCIGHSELVRGKRVGVFAAAESIRRLLDDHDLADTVSRSERRIALLKRDRYPSARRAGTTLAGSPVTPTRAVTRDAAVPATP